MSGIGEKFVVNYSTGTATMSIPIATSTGRGLDPQLSLTYNSGSNNGPFGFGWELSLPAITRKTEKGIPRYQESDAFLLAGVEELVPIFRKDQQGNATFQEELHDEYVVRRYSPRVDQSFLRIERWTKPTNGHIYWRTITPDNITSVFGRDDNSRIYDPESAKG